MRRPVAKTRGINSNRPPDAPLMQPMMGIGIGLAAIGG
jgi:hypothetical protein